ncbi:MAG: MFS transporter [Betaproteobacteria bacterium]
MSRAHMPTCGHGMTAPAPHPLLVAALAASQFAPPFMISGVAVALPAMGSDLAAGATALSLVETLFLGTAVAFMLPAGRLGDAADKVMVFKAGMVAFAATSILAGLVDSMNAVLVLRFLQGAASAAVSASGPAIVADAVPPERRGGAYGIVIGAVYAGLTLGPVCAGFLVEWWGWRAVFLAGGAAVLALLIPAHLLLHAAWRRPAPRAVHVPGTVLLNAAMLALVGGAATLREGAAGWAAAALGIALLAVFVVTQRRAEAPLVNIGLLVKNRVLAFALLVQCLLYCNAFGAVFLLAIYVQAVLGRGADVAGEVLAVGSLLMAAVAPFAGRLADRVRPGVVASWGVGIALIAGVWAAFLGAGWSLVEVALVLAIQGVGFAFFSSPNMARAMNSVPRERSGLAGGLSATARSFGMVLGMLIVGALVSVNLGHEPVGADPARFIATMQAAFWVLAALTALALAISAWRLRSG